MITDKEYNDLLDAIKDECDKLEKISTAVKELDKILAKIKTLNCPQEILDKIEQMLNDWRELYWYKNLDSISFDEILKKIKKIRNN